MDFTNRLLALIAKYDSYEHFNWAPHPTEPRMVFRARVNDVFQPGSDLEDVTEEDLDLLQKTFEEVSAMEGEELYADAAVPLWVARKRNRKPWHRFQVHQALEPLYRKIGENEEAIAERALDALQSSFPQAFANAKSEQEVRNENSKIQGKEGALTAILSRMGALSPDARKRIGARINTIKAEVELAISQRLAQIASEELEVLRGILGAMLGEDLKDAASRVEEERVKAVRQAEISETIRERVRFILGARQGESTVECAHRIVKEMNKLEALETSIRRTIPRVDDLALAVQKVVSEKLQLEEVCASQRADLDSLMTERGNCLSALGSQGIQTPSVLMGIKALQKKLQDILTDERLTSLEVKS